MPYLNISKICGYSSENEGCKYPFYALNGTRGESSYAPYSYDFYLIDGTYVRITPFDDTTQKFVDVVLDINGPKKPNKLGKDVFLVRYLISASWLTTNVGKFTPPDMPMTRDKALNDPNGCNYGATGAYCLNLIMMDSWQISNDYPW